MPEKGDEDAEAVIGSLAFFGEGAEGEKVEDGAGEGAEAYALEDEVEGAAAWSHDVVEANVSVDGKKDDEFNAGAGEVNEGAFKSAPIFGSIIWENVTSDGQ